MGRRGAARGRRLAGIRTRALRLPGVAVDFLDGWCSAALVAPKPCSPTSAGGCPTSYSAKPLAGDCRGGGPSDQRPSRRRSAGRPPTTFGGRALVGCVALEVVRTIAGSAFSSPTSPQATGGARGSLRSPLGYAAGARGAGGGGGGGGGGWGGGRGGGAGPCGGSSWPRGGAGPPHASQRREAGLLWSRLGRM